MRNIRILITGGSGFIGTSYIELLLRTGEAEFINIDIKPPRNVAHKNFRRECDLLDASRLKNIIADFSPTHVVHLAARTDLEEKHDLRGYAVNTDGVQNVLKCVKATASVRRIIVTSSQLVCKVGHVPQSDSEYCPNTLYGESKVLTETITREMNGGGKEWCLVRPTTVWGPQMNPHYQRMLELIRRGRYFHCGHGKLYKSYSYAGNIAHQYLKILLAPTNQIHRETFYLADYEPISLRDYTEGLAKAMGVPSIPTVPISLAKCLAVAGDTLNAIGLKTFPFNSFRLRNILTEYQFNMDKTKDVCGDLPFSFEDGLRATAEWYLASQVR